MGSCGIGTTADEPSEPPTKSKPMRVTTWNVNGFRAALRKGFPDFFKSIDPDVLLLQEIRVFPEQLPDAWASPPGWYVHWNPAVRPGYSGTAILSKYPITILGTGMDGHDSEGRIIRAQIEGIQLINVYLPSGSSGDERQRFKEIWMDDFREWARQFSQAVTPTIIGGDINVAHTERDIFHAKSNAKTSGFMPHERAWLGALLDDGWRDFIREQYGDVHGPYTWWSNRGRARELDRGWRIDYLLGNCATANGFNSGSVNRNAGLTISDHAPVTIDVDCNSFNCPAGGKRP